MTRCFVFSFFLSIACPACFSFAEEAPHYMFCVVQNPIHPGQDPSGRSYAQDAGVDARGLTIELSQRQRDGHPVTAISLTRDARETNAVIERADCSYVIDLERHVPADEPTTPEGFGSASPMRDREMIVYTLRSHDSRKKIFSAMVSPTTYRGHSERPASVPYPRIADAVLRKVANTSDQKGH